MYHEKKVVNAQKTCLMNLKHGKLIFKRNII